MRKTQYFLFLFIVSNLPFQFANADEVPQKTISIFDSIQEPNDQVNPLVQDSEYNIEKVLRDENGELQLSLGSENGDNKKDFIWLQSLPFKSFQEAEANFEEVMAKIDDYLLARENSKINHIKNMRVVADCVAHPYRDKDAEDPSTCEHYEATITIYNGLVLNTARFVYPGTVLAVYSNSRDLKEKAFIWKVFLSYEVRVRQVVGIYAYSNKLSKVLDGRLIK